MIFTGSKDVDIIILNKLNDKDLFNIKLSCKHFNDIISDDLFWLKRILSRYNVSIDKINKYKKDSWKNFYIKDLRKINPIDFNMWLKYGVNLLIALKETYNDDIDDKDFDDYCYLKLNQN